VNGGPKGAGGETSRTSWGAIRNQWSRREEKFADHGPEEFKADGGPRKDARNGTPDLGECHVIFDSEQLL
jgi:hypothetical protein